MLVGRFPHLRRPIAGVRIRFLGFRSPLPKKVLAFRSPPRSKLQKSSQRKGHLGPRSPDLQKLRARGRGGWNPSRISPFDVDDDRAFESPMNSDSSYVLDSLASDKGMAMVFRSEDAKNWSYKGEGAANLVLSYHGFSTSLVGKVLRIQKLLKGRTQSANGSEVLSRHEQILWGHVEELVESISKEIADQVFVMNVMSPLLGSVHVDGGIRVLLSSEFLESVEKNIYSQRPSRRVDATEVDRLGGSALLVSDHSVFLSEFIAKGNAIKKQVSRFKMHQLLKFKQGEISQISDYDPLDLFSGSKDRIYQAIVALFATPQNNFRIFLNGTLVFGGLGGGMDDGAVQSHEMSENIEEHIKVSGLQLASFLELVAEVVFKSGVLNQLQTAQKLDVFDIEGAIHSYYDIISQPCTVCEGLSDDALLHQYSFLHSLPLEESLKIVREYLIAATAKDCSLMISFRPREDGESASEYGSVYLKSLNQSFDYKANFIDLDMKPLKKMVHYYALDQKIVSFYTKNVEIEGTYCKSAIGDTEDCKFNGN